VHGLLTEKPRFFNRIGISKKNVSQIQGDEGRTDVKHGHGNSAGNYKPPAKNLKKIKWVESYWGAPSGGRHRFSVLETESISSKRNSKRGGKKEGVGGARDPKKSLGSGVPKHQLRRGGKTRLERGKGVGK